MSPFDLYLSLKTHMYYCCGLVDLVFGYTLCLVKFVSLSSHIFKATTWRLSLLNTQVSLLWTCGLVSGYTLCLVKIFSLSSHIFIVTTRRLCVCLFLFHLDPIMLLLDHINGQKLGSRRIIRSYQSLNVNWKWMIHIVLGVWDHRIVRSGLQFWKTWFPSILFKFCSTPTNVQWLWSWWEFVLVVLEVMSENGEWYVATLEEKTKLILKWDMDCIPLTLVWEEEMEWNGKEWKK